MLVNVWIRDLDDVYMPFVPGFVGGVTDVSWIRPNPRNSRRVQQQTEQWPSPTRWY